MSTQWTRPAGWCSRCGTAFFAGHGAQCASCGSPIAPMAAAAVGYSYPALPAHTVQVRRTSHVNLLVTAAISIGILVVGITALAVLVRPKAPALCNNSCPPQNLTGLQAAASYRSDKYGFTIDYDPSWTIDTSGGSDHIGFDVHGDALIFDVVQEQDLSVAVQNAINALPSAKFQGITSMGDVRGAEIGLVSGKGTVYSGQFFSDTGGQAQPVRLAVVAAQRDGVTVVATMISSPSDANALAPYGLASAQQFDIPLTNFHWKNGDF